MERHEEMLSPEEQYMQFAPTLDADGFSLYAAAEEVTGLKVYEEYPNEDNHEKYEMADGHTLLRYLENHQVAMRKKRSERNEDPGVERKRRKEKK